MLDLTNQNFGKLTAVSPIRINGKRYWHCKCECGNEINVLTASLTTGNTKSCGCYRKEVAAKKGMKNLVGQIFGELTVIQDSGERQNRNILWTCQCSCGNTIKVQGTALISGHTQSCGHIKSMGEYRLNNILTRNNIFYETQKKFEKCKSTFEMPFDFAIYNNQKELLYLIEYDGDIHFEYRETGWNTKEAFIKRVKNDSAKNKYCLDNNISLYRIPYYDLNSLNKIEDILQDKYLVKQINHYNIDMSVLEEVE